MRFVMSLKKYLIRFGRVMANGGQVTMEYFLLLVVLIALTVVGRSAFFSQFRSTMDNYNRQSLHKIQTAGGDSAADAEGDGPIEFTPPSRLAGTNAFWGEGDNGLPATIDDGDGGSGDGHHGGGFPL